MSFWPIVYWFKIIPTVLIYMANHFFNLCQCIEKYILFKWLDTVCNENIPLIIFSTKTRNIYDRMDIGWANSVYISIKSYIIKIEVVIKSRGNTRKSVFSLTIFDCHIYSNTIKYV